MWTSFAAWATPTTLFILVNAVIAVIALTSRFGAPKTSHRRHLHGGPALLRPPSLLDRVKSFDFSLYYNSGHCPDPNPDPNPAQLARAPSVLDRIKSIALHRSDSNSSARETEHPQHQKPSPEQTHDHIVNRSKSDSGTHTPTALEMSFRRRLQKSLSEKLTWAPFTATEPPQAETEEASVIERRRPATSRAEIGERETAPGEEEEEEVDARADDFINKFKQQLKLQRLESLLRYRDAIKGKK
ncbi:uncharacterized protein LOC111016466 [Momordica charantia]|uniref:Uncharacterized protein LOC111016466 n=1 Tax=Momordica charantia TaxID=3673 RepID=A0A6J1D2Q6_MOMCH|nr:uncharacterized protein LOC111016466 [Momordica charantia]